MSALRTLFSNASFLRQSISQPSLYNSSLSRNFSVSTPLQKYKLKTHSGTRKRWTALPNGLFKRGKVGKVHLNTHKAASRVNRLCQTAYSLPAQTVTLKKLMPYA
ncbi:hypothetical protein FRC02_010048 [Tulasnella sp. 418]|nr:hypothetical protein FRC02_010048 [Tulasnella sp. 418]